MDERHTPTGAITDLDATGGAGGVVWSASPDGLHVNLVVLAAGGSIPSHVNDSLDVLLICLAGMGTLGVDDDGVELVPHRAVLVPRGARRGVLAGDGGIRYLTIHAAPPPMGLGATRSGRPTTS
jgi:quercetin dioxygenase-like cupin family protein